MPTQGDGSRASTSSGSRARISNSKSGISGSRWRIRWFSFLERESAGIGLARVEAAARIISLVRIYGLRRAEMMLLTESQESGKDTDELHCGCCGGGLVAEGKVSGLDSGVERMERLQNVARA